MSGGTRALRAGSGSPPAAMPGSRSAAVSAQRGRSRTLSAALAAGVAATALLGLAGCTGGGEAEADPAVSDPAAEEVDMPLPEEQAEGVPDECFEHYPWATGPADIGSLELLPEGWPEPPEGSTLCTVDSGGVAESASYVTDTPTGDVLAHYEGALGDYTPVRISGEENGTGYDSLDGSDGGALSFQIREAEGGFMVTFISGEAPVE